MLFKVSIGSVDETNFEHESKEQTCGHDTLFIDCSFIPRNTLEDLSPFCYQRYFNAVLLFKRRLHTIRNALKKMTEHVPDEEGAGAWPQTSGPALQVRLFRD